VPYFTELEVGLNLGVSDDFTRETILGEIFLQENNPYS
jgi:hypothetical protein